MLPLAARCQSELRFHLTSLASLWASDNPNYMARLNVAADAKNKSVYHLTGESEESQKQIGTTGSTRLFHLKCRYVTITIPGKTSAISAIFPLGPLIFSPWPLSFLALWISTIDNMKEHNIVQHCPTEWI